MINKENIRLRFAPSPTGYLHVGGLRTALYNYLFAKKNNGKLILRIEDTDQKRLVDNSIDNIIKVLNWSGIEFDEGPHLKTGTKGPYIQSERINIYKKYMLELVRKGDAYICFYSDERMKKINSSDSFKKTASEYDKRFKDLIPGEAINRMTNGENCVVRLAMPIKGKVIIDDLIKGKTSFDYKLIDDPIIIKSDGFPTYHFANVVDDYNMQISHVIRGEEWLPSLPKHIHLYNCFNWRVPKFAHLPLLLNENRTKLSKRQGDVAVEDYIEKGYMKDALINFIALLGWHESNNQEFYTISELKKVFSLDRVQSSGAVFNLQKLNWLNQHYIKNLSSAEIVKLSEKFIPKKWKVNHGMVELIKEKLSKISDIKDQLTPFFIAPEVSRKSVLEKYPKSNIYDIAVYMIKHLEKHNNMNKDLLSKIMNDIAEKTGSKGKNLWQPVRFIITGQEHGADLSSFISLLGNNECIKRFNNVL
ncbi:MAG: glutamate--tRNA ligase [Candidatus Marinimicrobia bacterium]|nr:glutamate--tRNA ligase [Candidatus Neomarinimicrobiota bacterium]|tara:strand:- start:4546 stop:5970 length:1425 start_codon:yes stop_codon:yes gene_type:complete